MLLKDSDAFRIVIASDFHHPANFSLAGFNEIANARADIAVLNGDVFDPFGPPEEAVMKKWLSIVHKIAKEVVILPGNHDRWIIEMKDVLTEFNIKSSSDLIIENKDSNMRLLITHGDELDMLKTKGIIKSRSRLQELLPVADYIREKMHHSGWVVLGHTHLLEVLPQYAFASCGTYCAQTNFFKKEKVIPGYGYILLENGEIKIRRTHWPEIINYATAISRETRW